MRLKNGKQISANAAHNEFRYPIRLGERQGADVKILFFPLAFLAACSGAQSKGTTQTTSDPYQTTTSGIIQNVTRGSCTQNVANKTCTEYWNGPVIDIQNGCDPAKDSIYVPSALPCDQTGAIAYCSFQYSSPGLVNYTVNAFYYTDASDPTLYSADMLAMMKTACEKQTVSTMKATWVTLQSP